MSKIIQKCPQCGKAAVCHETLRDVDLYEVDLRDPEALANRNSIAGLIALHDALVAADPYFRCEGPGGCEHSFSYTDTYPDARRLAVAQFLFGPKS